MSGRADDVTDSWRTAGDAWLRGIAAWVPGHSGVSAPTGQSTAVLGRLAALQADLLREHAQLWQAMSSGGDIRSSGETNTDRRFSDAAWRRDPFYDFLRQSYVLNARFTLGAVEVLEVDTRTRERLRFAARQLIDAMSPANFIATNPEAMRLALETRGESLSAGLKNLTQDAQKGRLSITDESAFEVGRNLAITEGAVIFENELMQLIQYKPLTPKVYRRPILMVPPCINKFYILDLQPENSFVRHAVESGHTVFMVSWRNVNVALGGRTWDDYLMQGVLQPIHAITEITGEERINALGFCVGGTILASALAVLAARGQAPVASLTLLTAMLDFSDTGELGLFVDEASVSARESAIGGGGIMPGRELAFVFSALRANDLVWSYVVNNYLKGRSPAAFDILAWNADPTNLPGPMYCSYLRNMYLNNSLREAGKLSMLGESVDLTRLDLPAYVFAAREDHIVPWQTAYRSTGLLSGEVRFVLGASGHVAGVVNPASRDRRSYWTGEGLCPESAATWLDVAREQPGSWWRDWTGWLSQQGGGQRKARQRLGGTHHRPIEPAPGRYVREKAD